MGDMDQVEERRAKSTQKKVESASFQYGMLKGKHESSDLYFQYMLTDLQKAHAQKVATLTKTSGIMEREMTVVLAEVQELLKVSMSQPNSLVNFAVNSLPNSPGLEKSPPMSPADSAPPSPIED